MPQVELSHLSNQLRDVMASTRLGPRELRIDGEGSHECPPGKFSGSERAYDAVRRRVESRDVGNVGPHLPLEKFPDLAIELGSKNLRRVRLRLSERIAIQGEKYWKDVAQSDYLNGMWYFAPVS